MVGFDEKLKRRGVVPRKGTWIETHARLPRGVGSSVSSPARGRGLKQSDNHQNLSLWGVVPRKGTWIETEIIVFNILDIFCVVPARGRGLKPLYEYQEDAVQGVVPRKGTWIETSESLHPCQGRKCRPPQGDVD